MQVLIWSILILYGLFLVFIFVYSTVQLSLAISYIRSKRNVQTLPREPEVWPEVTVQLPIFNERYVVKRLLDSVVKLDYPKGKLEIQVLDDSTDDTSDIVRELVSLLVNEGFDLKHIQRQIRTGFKAGALKEATAVARGEFIAIFDADFLPKPEFLKKSLPYFEDKRVGAVQSRWEHLNKDYNLLTKLQAFGLDAHFSVEQAGRNHAGHFINFNGTAGIWRKTTIQDAGNWQADTLTEDLDLSYRAQLRKWKFKFLEDLGSPAELPAAINALKTQQYRWNKGAAECAVKNLPRVFRSDLHWKHKLHAMFHLMNSFVFVCILLTGVLSFPLLLIKQYFIQYDFIFQIGAFLSVSFLFIGYLYWLAMSQQFSDKRKAFYQFLVYFPLFLSVYMGMSLHNSIAVMEGYLGIKTPFVRTPKFDIKDKKDSWLGNVYFQKVASPIFYLELLLLGYFSFALMVGFVIGDLGLLPFHIMLVFGFASISGFTVIQSRA